ncbi:MAG: aminotransferase class I/II-fold pyridoxal phosphate-dependent enzyme [Eubacteriales bacterium]|nr:aminotransferase class I/II-fold pyridoxal phosphate-dependent enzyme [Eubacteriales bacterium]
MLHFDSDYMEGAHPDVLERLIKTNFIQTPGYGTDIYCDMAKEKIKSVCGLPDADVFFLVGGTQTNATVIDSLLPPYAGVVAADTGHIAVHESGAVEASGHKVITIPNKSGKIEPESLKALLVSYHSDEAKDHMVYPGMVYISHPTERGTLYTANELKRLKEICTEYDIPLFLDGARLGYALAADGTDVTLPYIARHTDVFYIGGTKVGALFGEAVVIPKKGRIKHFVTMIKQHGGLLAKGRLLGIQFDALFTEDLYYKISRHAVEIAARLEEGFRAKGYTMMYGAPANQKFVLLENAKMAELREHATFEIWEKYGKEHTVVRFVTSWATKAEDAEKLIELL